MFDYVGELVVEEAARMGINGGVTEDGVAVGEGVKELGRCHVVEGWERGGVELVLDGAEKGGSGCKDGGLQGLHVIEDSALSR
jgi:hypothetical protein